MKNSKFSRIFDSLTMALAVGGFVLFLTSASTMEDSNKETISELSAAVEQMSAEIASLKKANNDASLSAEPLLGEIALVGFGFAPRGWLKCEGQLLPISQNSALFSLLGTTYGGDGRTTFGLPDLRGRVPLGAGAGPGLPNYQWGQKVGLGVAKGGTKAGGLGMNYVIASQGVYPSRN